jgi:hypothetical protein
MKTRIVRAVLGAGAFGLVALILGMVGFAIIGSVVTLTSGDALIVGRIWAAIFFGLPVLGFALGLSGRLSFFRNVEGPGNAKRIE